MLIVLGIQPSIRGTPSHCTIIAFRLHQLLSHIIFIRLPIILSNLSKVFCHLQHRYFFRCWILPLMFNLVNFKWLWVLSRTHWELPCGPLVFTAVTAILQVLVVSQPVSLILTEYFYLFPTYSFGSLKAHILRNSECLGALEDHECAAVIAFYGFGLRHRFFRLLFCWFGWLRHKFKHGHFILYYRFYSFKDVLI